MSSQQENRQSKKIDLKTVIIFAVIFVLIVAVGVLTFVLVSNKSIVNTSNVPSIQPNVITGNASVSLDEKLAEMQKEVDEGSIGVAMDTEITLENGNSVAKGNIGNPARNTKSFVISIVMTDTNEEVYRSGLIPPDTYINEMQLNTVLEKGSYPAATYFEVYNEEGEVTGKTGVNITINVLN